VISSLRLSSDLSWLDIDPSDSGLSCAWGKSPDGPRVPLRGGWILAHTDDRGASEIRIGVTRLLDRSPCSARLEIEVNDPSPWHGVGVLRHELDGLEWRSRLTIQSRSPSPVLVRWTTPGWLPAAGSAASDRHVIAPYAAFDAQRSMRLGMEH
jgi:hypothetical protein